MRDKAKDPYNYTTRVSDHSLRTVILNTRNSIKYMHIDKTLVKKKRYIKGDSLSGEQVLSGDKFYF
jgi:hypothetical protein